MENGATHVNFNLISKQKGCAGYAVYQGCFLGWWHVGDISNVRQTVKLPGDNTTSPLVKDLRRRTLSWLSR